MTFLPAAVFYALLASTWPQPQLRADTIQADLAGKSHALVSGAASSTRERSGDRFAIVRPLLDELRRLRRVAVRPACQENHTMEDIARKALRRAPADGKGFTHADLSLLSHHASVHSLLGNYSMSIALQNRAARLAGTAKYEAVAFARLARYALQGGAYDVALQAISRARRAAKRNESAESSREWRQSNTVRRLPAHVRNQGWINFVLWFAEASLAEAFGELRTAERLYRKVLHTSEKFKSPNVSIYEDVALVRLALARTVMRQGRLVEAEILAQEVLWDQLLNDTPEPLMLSALIAVGETYYAAGQHDIAAALAKEAVELFEFLCASPASLLKTNAQRIIARSAVAQGHFQLALDRFSAIQRDLRDERGLFARGYAGDPDRALALILSGNAVQAAADLRSALRRTASIFGDTHRDTLRMGAILGMAEAAAGRYEQALAIYERTIPQLVESYSETGAGNTPWLVTSPPLRLSLEAYLDILARTRGVDSGRAARRELLERGFQIAALVRSRAVSQAVEKSAARARLADPTLSGLVRRVQDAKHRLDAFNRSLRRVVRRQGYPERKAVRRLRALVRTATSERISIFAEVKRRFPSYSRLMRPSPVTYSQARELLRPGEALISFFVGENGTYVWAVPRDGEASFAAVRVGREPLGRLVDELRRALAPRARTIGDIPTFDTAAAHALYKTLLAPVEGGWRNANSLLVVPDGPLGRLPFSVLVIAPPKQATTVEAREKILFERYRSVPFLVRSHAVTVVPSVSSLKALRGVSPIVSRATRSFAGFADPQFGTASPIKIKAAVSRAATAGRLTVRGLPLELRNLPETKHNSLSGLAQLPRLPETAAEVLTIARVLKANPHRDVFTGALASEARVKSMRLSEYRVLAFATHGLVPGQLAGLSQPALALSPAGGGEDGLLTMGEVLSLKLNADWVVLSACNTAAGEGTGVEAISGLGRAFFYAGTRALLVSHWNVETRSARVLTTKLFRSQRDNPSLSHAQALRRAMLHLIDRGGLVGERGRLLYAYAHPLFWAPFSLVGEGGALMR